MPVKSVHYCCLLALISWLMVSSAYSAVPIGYPEATGNGTSSTPSATAGPTDFTFVVWSDLHFDTYNSYNQRIDCREDINSIAGKAYPPAIGGTVATPAFVLITGDITENGLAPQWSNGDGDQNNDFISCVGGLHFPYYVIRGNHDNFMHYVNDAIVAMYGELYYSFDYQGVHFVGLDAVWQSPQVPPSECAWLQADLARLTPDTPIIPFIHFNVEETSDWTSLQTVLAGYNVPLILNGHQHNIRKYTWYGIPGYSVGHNREPGASNEGFLVVHVTDTLITCVSYNGLSNQWYTDSRVILQTAIAGLPRADNPPAPTATPPACLGNLLANGGLESYTGSEPRQIASNWIFVDNTGSLSFKRSPGLNGQGYGQTIGQNLYTPCCPTYAGYLYQSVSAIPGHVYRLSAWGRPENAEAGKEMESPVQYGLGLDPTGGTSFANLAADQKVVHYTHDIGYGLLGYHLFQLEVTAIGPSITAFLYYWQDRWNQRPARVIWDHVCLSDTGVILPTSTPTFTPSPTVCAGDADRNGFVNGRDYTSVRDHYGESGCGPGDSNGDCFVNLSDFRTVRDNYGLPCPGQ